MTRRAGYLEYGAGTLKDVFFVELPNLDIKAVGFFIIIYGVLFVWVFLRNVVVILAIFVCTSIWNGENLLTGCQT